MSGLPRGPMQPLPPPPGQFDRVAGEARVRRHRRALHALVVVAVFVGGVGGGLALDGGVSTVPRALVDLATGVSAPGTAPPADSRTEASVTPDPTADAEPAPSPTQEPSPEPATAASAEPGPS